ncbi:MAG: hypothetical protein U0935_23160 [Pirellulales bacterium]
MAVIVADGDGGNCVLGRLAWAVELAAEGLLPQLSHDGDDHPHPPRHPELTADKPISATIIP